MKRIEHFLDLFLDKVYSLAESSIEVIPTIEKLYEEYGRDNSSNLYEDVLYGIYVVDNVIQFRFNLYKHYLRVIYHRDQRKIIRIVLTEDARAAELTDREKLLSKFYLGMVGIGTNPHTLNNDCGLLIEEENFPPYITMLDFYSRDFKGIEERVRYCNELSKIRYDEE